MSAGCKWWSYSKDEQKQLIEDAVEEQLLHRIDLSKSDKLLLTLAIGHAMRGLFGLACQDLSRLSMPEYDWSLSSSLSTEEIGEVTAEKLHNWLRRLRETPTQMLPIFR